MEHAASTREHTTTIELSILWTECTMWYLIFWPLTWQKSNDTKNFINFISLFFAHNSNKWIQAIHWLKMKISFISRKFNAQHNTDRLRDVEGEENVWNRVFHSNIVYLKEKCTKNYPIFLWHRIINDSWVDGYQTVRLFCMEIFSIRINCMVEHWPMSCCFFKFHSHILLFVVFSLNLYRVAISK